MRCSDINRCSCIHLRTPPCFGRGSYRGISRLDEPCFIYVDLIKAIDLMTRRLVAANQRPVTVGTFFSLGHSTIVVVTSIIVAATSSAINSKFDTFSKVGGIIGTSISAAFLILLGIMNLYILYKLIRQMRKLIALVPGEEPAFELQGTGCLFLLFRKLFKMIDR